EPSCEQTTQGFLRRWKPPRIKYKQRCSVYPAREIAPTSHIELPHPQFVAYDGLAPTSCLLPNDVYPPFDPGRYKEYRLTSIPHALQSWLPFLVKLSTCFPFHQLPFSWSLKYNHSVISNDFLLMVTC